MIRTVLDCTMQGILTLQLSLQPIVCSSLTVFFVVRYDSREKSFVDSLRLPYNSKIQPLFNELDDNYLVFTIGLESLIISKIDTTKINFIKFISLGGFFGLIYGYFIDYLGLNGWTTSLLLTFQNERLFIYFLPGRPGRLYPAFL